MITLQGIAFGAMLILTPSLLIMAYLLWVAPEMDEG
jgi:hypothetical protein